MANPHQNNGYSIYIDKLLEKVARVNLDNKHFVEQNKKMIWFETPLSTAFKSNSKEVFLKLLRYNKAQQQPLLGRNKCLPYEIITSKNNLWIDSEVINLLFDNTGLNIDKPLSYINDMGKVILGDNPLV